MRGLLRKGRLLALALLATGTGSLLAARQSPDPTPPAKAWVHPRADLMGLGTVIPGAYTLFVYRWSNAPQYAGDNLLYLKLKSPAALPLGKPVAVGGKQVEASGYEVGSKMRHRMAAIRGTVTRLASGTDSYTLRLQLSCTGRASVKEVRRDVVFPIDTTNLDIQLPRPPASSGAGAE